MYQHVRDNLISWAKEKEHTVFEEFVDFLHDAECEGKNMSITYYDETQTGTIETCNFLYNKRFPDFDFDIKLLGQEYGLAVSYIFMDSIQKKSDTEYEIINKEGVLFSIKVVL